MEMEKIVNKSKQQVDKQNSRQNITENEVPDKKSKPVVKFNLDMNSNSDIDLAKKHSNLDLEALELTNKIFSTTNNEEDDVKEAAPKAKDISTKTLHHNASQSKVMGDLDKEAIKLTNVIFSNTNETIESEDMEAYLNSSKKPISKTKAPLKSIMKNTTPKNIINKDGDSVDTNIQNTNHIKAEENCGKLKQKSELSFSKTGGNQDKDKNGQKNPIFDEKVSTNGLTVTQGGLSKDLTKEKSKDKDILVNGIKDSPTLPSIDMKTKKGEHLSKDNVSQILNNQKPSSHVMETNDEKRTSLKSKSYVKTVEKDEQPTLNGVQTNGNTPAHKSFTKNIAVNMTPSTKKKETNKEDHSNLQNSKKNNVEEPTLDTNMRKKLVENKIGGSSTQMNDKNENSCAGQIYKEKQPGLEIAEAHKGKNDESIASKNLPNIEVKHAQQCFVVNQPLSPALNRKDIGPNTSQPQTDGRRLGSQSEIVLDKKQVEKAQITSVTKLPNTVNSESKKGVVVSHTPNDTKTKGENTRFLEPSKNNYSSQQIDDIPKRSDLNKDLERMDKEHEVKMQNISKIMESSKEKTINLPKIEMGKHSHTSISEARQVIVDSQIPNDTKTRGGVTNYSGQSVHNGLSLVPQALQRSYTSSYVDPNSKSDLNKDLEKLDKRHAVKMQRIGEGIDDTINEKKLDISKSEVHANRPAILGPSRFDNPSKYSAEYPKEIKPKRNDTVYNFNKESPKSNGTSGSYEKTPPSSYQISKSSTTVLDTRTKSPELLRKKLDRNFNASPEPFFSSKPTNSVHFSDQPSSKYPSLNPTTTSSTLSSLKDIKDNSARQFDTSSTKSQSPGSKTPLLGSKSYSTLPSVSSLPAPASLLPASGSYSSSSYNTSSSYSSPSFPSIASLPKPASYSSTSSFASQTPITKPGNYTSSTSPSTLSSPSNYAQSSNFDNRAKSEGSTLSTNSPGTMQSNYSLSTSSNKTSSDLYMKIQAAKDKHKSNIQNTMSVDKNNWKPPVIKQKFERPDPTPVKYTMTLGRDKTSRMQDRERTVIDRVMTDRTSRGKSDDFLKSSSYRL
eukprot:TRINITY_DN34579_c0_g1_i1.p1 TRINITY_DN34579_c0_g1~~TRINITY_DN34579_c0_g1_i1.p1  ORF type:complete len:1063 (-),score=231.73 TRINITY_DN34579_c0_g1_i1:142-3330(-)